MFANKYPVLVIGAGPTGLSSANLLGMYGIPTVLAEAKTTINRLPRSTFVDDEFFRLLDTIGLADIVRRQSVGPATYEQYSILGFLLNREEGQITSHNFPTRSAIFQPWLDQTLLDGLARFSHVEVLLGHKVEDITQDDDSVSVTFVTQDGRAVSGRYSFVLAADGSRSFVREKLGIEFETVTPLESRSFRIDVEGDPDKTPIMRSRPGLFRHHASSFPAPNGRRYGFSVRPDEDIEKLTSEESLKKLLRPFRDASNVKIIRKAVYSFRTRVAKEFRRGRIFILGDAAHEQPPFNSQGMNGGARDANHLCWRIAAVMRGAAGDAVLQAYQEERYPIIRATVIEGGRSALGRRRTLWSILWRDIKIKLRSLSRWGESVERSIANAPHVETGRKTEVTSGVLVGDPRQDAGGLLGRLIFNPWVEYQGRPKMLDEVIGREFAIIGVETGDGNVLPAGLSHPVWKSLRANIVILGREEPRERRPLVPVMRVLDDRFNPVWPHYQGQWLIVRPDKVIVAIADSQALDTVADQLADRLGSALKKTPSANVTTAHVAAK